MLTGHPFKYKMDYAVRLASNFTWKSIGMNLVKLEQDVCGKTSKRFSRVRVIFIFVAILTSIKSLRDKSRVTYYQVPVFYSPDWTNTGVSCIFLTVNLFRHPTLISHGL